MLLKEMLDDPEVKKMYRELVKKFHTDIEGGDIHKIQIINNLKDSKEIKNKEIKDLYKKWIKNEKVDYDDTISPEKKTITLKKWANKIIKKYPLNIKVRILKSNWGIKVIFSIIKNKKGELKNIVLDKAETFNSQNELEMFFKKKLEESI